MPLAAVAAVGAISSLGGAAIASSGAQNAASTQAGSAVQAANIQASEADKGLQFQEQQYATSQQELAPWLQSGATGLANLDYLLGLPVSGSATIPSFGTPVSGGGIGAPAGGPMPSPSAGPAPTPAGMSKLLPAGGASGVRVGGSEGFTPGGTAAPVSAPGGFANSGLSNGMFVRMPNGVGGVIQNGQFQPLTAQQWQAQGGGNFQQAPILNPSQISALQSGAGSSTHSVPMSSLVNPNIGPAGSLAQPFVAPTGLTEQNDPGYQERLQLGTDAIQRSAAASGGVLTGGTARALDQFGQDYASNEYGNVYNRAFNTFESNQTNLYNRLAAMSGLGQQTASTAGALGNQSTNSIASILMNLGAMQGQGINNAAAARGSGYVGSANAWSGALGGLGNNLNTLLLMNQLYPSGGGGMPTVNEYGVPPSGTMLSTADLAGGG
jgi:hypothetical protein